MLRAAEDSGPAPETGKGEAETNGKRAAGEFAPGQGDLLSAEPQFTVREDGIATVTWRTAIATGPGRVHSGFFMPDQDLDTVRWCGAVPEKKQEQTLSEDHQASFSVAQAAALARWHDGTPNGAGRVAVRVEIARPEGGSAIVDRIFGVRWVAGRYRRTAAVVEGPFVCRPQPSTVTISFRTDAPTRAQVTIIGPQGDRTLFESPAEGLRHEIPVRGLFSDMVYRYRVQIIPAEDPALSVAGPAASFRTAPTADSERAFTVACLSGSAAAPGGGEFAMEGVNVRSVRDLVMIAYRYGAELVAFPGDLIRGRTLSEDRFRRELRAWKYAVGPVGAYVPVVVTGGDQDVLLEAGDDGLLRDCTTTPAERVFAEEFVQFTNGPKPAAGAPPYRELVYSFDYGTVHFAVVHTAYWFTNRPGGASGGRAGVLDDRQLSWLDSDLTAARKRGVRHLFVLGHAPGFPCGGEAEGAMYWNGSIDEVNAARVRFWRILGREGVAAYLCGGERSYSRLRVDDSLVPGMETAVWQIVSGAAGGTYQAKDPAVPWSERVAAFTLRRHVCLLHIDGPRVTLRVIGSTGGTIEQFALTGE